MRAGAYLAAVTLAVGLMAGGVGLLWAATPAQAQQSASDDIEKRRLALLRQMLNQPSNTNLAFEYIRLSEQVGDYEGAVSTLERLQIYMPNTPQIQLQLGMLYYRLGAYDVARSYLAQALANPAATPELTSQAKLYLQQLQMTAEPPPFSGTLFSGIQWESNANYGPATNNVTLNGADFTLNNQATNQSDWSVLTIGSLHYSHDMHNQGDRFEFDLLGYSTEHFDLHYINLNFLEAAVGPSYNMKRWGLDNSRLFFYALGDLSWLGSDFYFGAPGAGVRVLSYGADRAIVDMRLETRIRQFTNSYNYPTNTDWNGAQTRANVTYSYFLTPGIVLTTQAQVQREASDKAYDANWGLSLNGGLAWTFSNPLKPSGRAWTWQISGGGLLRDYDQPDYSMSTENERDRVWWARTAMVIPVSDTLALIPQVQYTDQNSNYVLRRYDDLSTLVGLQKTF